MHFAYSGILSCLNMDIQNPIQLLQKGVEWLHNWRLMHWVDELGAVGAKARTAVETANINNSLLKE